MAYNTEHILNALRYAPIEQVNLYQVDLNEINLGSYLINDKSYHRLMQKVFVHCFQLIKQIYHWAPKKKLFEIEFTLVMKAYNVDTTKDYNIHLGTMPMWKESFYKWYRKYDKRNNLYVELFYILAYQKSTV
jgi:hypothetical protein